MNLRPCLRGAQIVLLFFGVAALSYWGFAFADGWAFQRAGDEQLAALLDASFKAAPGPRVPTQPISVGGLIGRIEIPRLELSVNIAEGVGSKVLRHAAGHVPGTALPGEPGNAGISAHRDTYFRPLRDIRKNDIINVTTLAGIFHYRVTSSRIVEPSDVTVLAPSTGQVLTLVTCYPFYYIGSAPSRFVVRAERFEPQT